MIWLDMKRICLFLTVIFSVCTLSLHSCSDYDGEVLSSDIIGTWKWDSFNTDETEAFFGEQYIQFSSDGQYIEVGIDGFGSEGEVDIIRGQWKQSGNTITVSGNGVPTTTAEITVLTDTDLTLLTLGIPMSYKRVADSEIAEYLN